MELDHPDGATPLDPDEIEGLRFKHVETRGELNQLEQQNIQIGLKWLERRKSIPEILSIFLVNDVIFRVSLRGHPGERNNYQITSSHVLSIPLAGLLIFS
ncbi:MAG: hypothetical protein ACC663_07420 [Gammaproteobacteria bacterium]